MNKRSIILALLLVAAGMQAVQAQVLKVWRNGKADTYYVSKVDSVQFVEDAYEWVDLGLPSGTLWATYNVGASSPDGLGSFFAWGETQPTNTVGYWEIYKFFSCFDEITGEPMFTRYYDGDINTYLLPEDDAATANWGSSWQMPSNEQILELIDEANTTTAWVSQSGVSGLQVTSKSNGNGIFLPAAGSCSQNAGKRGFYWSRTVLSNYFEAPYGSAQLLEFFSSGALLSNELRYIGCCVRPVHYQETPYHWPVKSITLDETELSLLLNATKQLTATVLPTYAKNRKVTWESSNSNIASVDEYGKVTAKAFGFCTITCRATDGSGVYADCNITVKDYDYVDLGLPTGTLWAAYNVGANAPHERGAHFAWGETAPKQDYNWETYRYSGNTQNTLTKYCTNSAYGTVDNKTELLPEDDAATVNWGSNWQMPSRQQLEELLDTVNNTKIVTVEVEGVRCRMITSRRNGRSIYIPAAGARFPDRNDYYNDNITGYYWSRTLNTDEPYNACHFYFTYNSKRNWTSSYYRNSGLTVRAVRKSAIQNVTSIQMDATAVIDLSVSRSVRLTATVLPSNATNQSLLWTSSNNNIATVDNTGLVEAVTTSPGTCTITCAATDGSGVKAQCELTILYYQGTTDGHEWVDLGLPSGTLWATQNVGSSFAHTIDEFGDYFAWGETQPKSEYSWSTYKYCNGSSSSLTKYCMKSSDGYNGFTDGLRELLPEDDAATANWGINWQMPSYEQQKELVDSRYTTTKWVTRYNGVNGLSVTSKINGKQIFLPAAGRRDDVQGNGNTGDYGYYWTRELLTSSSVSELMFSSNISDLGNYDYGSQRYVGYSVRPVRVPGPAIERPVTAIYLNRTSFKIAKGETQELTAEVYPSNASNPNIRWSSSDINVAWVDQSGKVTASGPGTCTITCSATDGSGVTAECQVTVFTRPVTEITLSKEYLLLIQGNHHRLTATVSPSNATDSNVIWSSSDTNVATVDQTGYVTSVAPGSCFVTCAAADGSGVSAQCEVKVSPLPSYVDLGLPSGTMWATFNVGASSPIDIGAKFAWAETEPRNFEDKYYKYYYKYYYVYDDNGYYGTKLTKYCWNSSYGYNGYTDDFLELLPEDDAATANWGGNWQMPSNDQIDELLYSDYTTCTWTTWNGVWGLQVMSKANNAAQIFLPAADYQIGVHGYYWSRTVGIDSMGELLDDPDYASSFYFTSDKIRRNNSHRYSGFCVRPVLKK